MQYHNPSTKLVLLISILVLLLVSLNSFPGLVAIASNDGDENISYLPVIGVNDCIPFPYISPDNPIKDQEVEDEINKIREAHDLLILENHPKITQAALLHSDDMADKNFTDHTGSDGSNAGDRLERACFKGNGWMEIIGWGFGGRTGSMIKWWMNSPPHHSAILSEWIDVFGAGYAHNTNSKWKHYWTVNFSMSLEEESANLGSLNTCRYISQGEEGGVMLTAYTSSPCENLASYLETE